jgi:folate-binding protein YgfZ
MPSSLIFDQAVELARVARRGGMIGLVSASDDGKDMACPAILEIRGPDASTFLHSQLTNEVDELVVGQGNVQAKVSRTGHLQHLFSLHRAQDADDVARFVGILPRQHVRALHDELDAYLFADDVDLEMDTVSDWMVIQGPQAAALLDAIFGSLGFEPWSTLPEGGHRTVRRARSSWHVSVPPGTFAVRRSLTGDPGYLIRFDPSAGFLDILRPIIRGLASQHDVVLAAPPVFSHALDILRMEAGMARIGPETTPKRRLLPETGLEQSTVSYTKGCYLGQEVIARVRTYGSVPNLLRAVVFRSTDAEQPAEPDLRLPEPGTPLVDAATGKTIGHFASSTWSPVRDAPIALAYLGRKHRTPGRTLDIALEQGTVQGVVALLPLYHAPDTAARVAHLYDLAIRMFADGNASTSLLKLEEALRLDPTFADAYEAIGVILGKAGKFHEAIDFFRRLEEVVPDEPLVNTNLSLYFMKLGDKQTAEDEAGKATLKSMHRQRGAQDVDVEADLQRSRERDAKRKLNMFRRVLEIDDVDPIALFGLGNAQLVLGQHQEAADHLQRALIVDKNNSAVYAACGQALEKLERHDEAIAVYRQGIEVASRKGDLMPLKQMEHRLLLLGGSPST